MSEFHDDPSPGTERVIEVLGNLTRVSGAFGTRQQMCSLILTDQRIVFAALTKEKVRELALQARTAAKQEGKGFLGRLGAGAQAYSTYHERYREMPPDTVLAETPGNFAIARADIQKIKFRVGMVDESRNTPDSFTIKTKSEKLKFNVAGSLSVVKEAFRAAGYAA